MTSAFAAPAVADVPVSHRGVAHEIVVVSGHVAPDDPRSLVDWPALGRLRGSPSPGSAPGRPPARHGTRVLQDRLLRAVGRDPDAGRGPEVGSHLEVALAVATGAVDAGLGVCSAAVDLDLEFVPVAREDYDVALPGRALDAAAPWSRTLHDPAVRAAVAALGGYDTSRAGTVAPSATRG